MPPINWTIAGFLERNGFPTAAPLPAALDPDFEMAASHSFRNDTPDTLTLTTADDAPPLCHGATGTYQVSVSANEELLHLTSVDDACPVRSVELAGGPHERVPDVIVPGYLK
ncbi:MAG: hypothetical protein GY788_17810 [bacterium]|nr:hypothetical protein [bacterium]